MERAMGFEPTTTTLARWSSTTELRSPLTKNKKRLSPTYHFSPPTQPIFSKMPDFTVPQPRHLATNTLDSPVRSP